MNNESNSKVKRINLTVKPEIDDLIRKIAIERGWKISMVIEKAVLNLEKNYGI